MSRAWGRGARGTVAAAVLAALVLAGAAPAGATDRQAAPTVGIVGDSLAFQAQEQIRDAVSLDHRIVFGDLGLAQRIRDILGPTREAMRGPRPPDIFIVLLGTSQSNGDRPRRWRHELRLLLDAVAPRADCVRVFDIDDSFTGIYPHHDRYAATYNRITRNLVHQYTKAEWVHFSAWADLAGPEFERPDILHHDLAGKIQIARLVRTAANGCDRALMSGPFWDVPDDSPAAEAVRWLGRNHIAVPYANDTYRARIANFVPTMVRGQFVTMLWRLAGRPEGFPPHPWTDGTAALDRPLRWAAATGVDAGYPDGGFHPAGSLTRGQVVGMLWRLEGRPTGFPPHPWSDAPPRLDPALDWVAATGLMSGYEDGTVRPGLPLSRGNTALLLYRYHLLP